MESWTPKPPEDSLALKVCDPACGSGSFPLAALRFLTEALYAALHHHERIRDHGGRAVLDLIKREDNGDTLASEALPCRPDDDEFEVRNKAVLRRYIVERCIYGVDLDPLAVELCRLSLWIETLGIHQAAERSEQYQQLRRTEEYQRLKQAFDLWCALWFWPPTELDDAPMPLDYAAGELSQKAHDIIRQLTARHRFFHWELEFSDVFNPSLHGFDAVLGNPPWDIAKPNSKEFFSAIDPLYHGYGKQEAVDKQHDYYAQHDGIEHQWLQYNASFRAMSNWVKYTAYPFGDRVTYDSNDKPSHNFNLGSGGKYSFKRSEARHDRWRDRREESSGYADAKHPFRHQGGGDINLYKLFLEQGHALLHRDGRLGLIVPSGLYSDHGTGGLRELFIDQSRWEWLFGFENRDKVFDIDGRFKFNPVIIQKGTPTDAIWTAFMRRDLADWEQAEDFVTEYPREQVVQFSPRSRALLEIQSQRDLNVLSKIYANAVLLGDEGPEGWGVQYATEFHMTNDSKLFPPLTKWEEWGFRPDEYSRWIKGPWKPIEGLWRELDVDPSTPKPLDATCAQRIEDGLQTGEVGRTECQVRCAQPPYDRLPIPRADIPPGIILSRHADAWLHEDDIPVVTFTEANGKPLKVKLGRKRDSIQIQPSGKAIACPLHDGRMVGQFDFSAKGWVSGAGRSAVWRDVPWVAKDIEPQYLIGQATLEWACVSSYLDETKKHGGETLYQQEKGRVEDISWRHRLMQNRSPRIAFMDITSATNEL